MEHVLVHISNIKCNGYCLGNCVTGVETPNHILVGVGVWVRLKQRKILLDIVTNHSSGLCELVGTFYGVRENNYGYINSITIIPSSTLANEANGIRNIQTEPGDTLKSVTNQVDT